MNSEHDQEVNEEVKQEINAEIGALKSLDRRRFLTLGAAGMTALGASAILAPANAAPGLQDGPAKGSTPCHDKSHSPARQTEKHRNGGHLHEDPRGALQTVQGLCQQSERNPGQTGRAGNVPTRQKPTRRTAKSAN